jgi:hypothetical protein
LGILPKTNQLHRRQQPSTKGYVEVREAVTAKTAVLLRTDSQTVVFKSNLGILPKTNQRLRRQQPSAKEDIEVRKAVTAKMAVVLCRDPPYSGWQTHSKAYL